MTFSHITMELSYNLDHINTTASKVLESLSSKTLLFIGEMGSGKTTFIKALTKVLGSEDVVTSPTFSLVNEYLIENDTIYHFDLYRIEDSEELYDFGIDEYLYSKAWKMIEWPDRLKDIELSDVNILTFNLEDNGARRLKLEINQSITPNLLMYSKK